MKYILPAFWRIAPILMFILLGSASAQDQQSKLPEHMGMFPTFPMTFFIGQQAYDWGAREFSSVLGGITRHDYAKSMESAPGRMVDLPELRRRLRDAAGVDNVFGEYVPRVTKTVTTECLRTGYKVEVSELEFVSDSHIFGAYILSPVHCSGGAPKPLPLFMFFHGQQATANQHVTIPAVDFKSMIQLAEVYNIHGDVAYDVASQGLAHVVVPIFITDSPSRVALNRLLLLRGSSLAALEVRKAEQVLDFMLKSRDIDETKIVAAGISMGAQNALLFTALNERIAALALLGWAADLSPDGLGLSYYSRDRLFDRNQPEELFWPGLLTVGDLNILYTLLAPRTLLLSAGRKDEHYSPRNVHQTFTKVINYYERLGAKKSRVSFGISVAPHVVDKSLLLPWMKCVFDGCPDDRPFVDDSAALGRNDLTANLLETVPTSAMLALKGADLVNMSVGAGTIRSLYLHAPNEVAFDLEIAAHFRFLNFAAGINEVMRKLSDDGVELKVTVEQDSEAKTLFTKVFDTKEATCLDNFSIPIDEIASRRVKLRFVVSERANTVADHFMILSPQLSIRAAEIAPCARN